MNHTKKVNAPSACLGTTTNNVAGDLSRSQPQKTSQNPKVYLNHHLPSSQHDLESLGITNALLG